MLWLSLCKDLLENRDSGTRPRNCQFCELNYDIRVAGNLKTASHLLSIPFTCRQKYQYLSPLTAEEEKEIVSAMNLSQGRWYKCPQGHVYSIGGCGEAMQRATCPECRLVIGGTRHQLFEGNMRAPEMMEGARTRLGRRRQNYN